MVSEQAGGTGRIVVQVWLNPVWSVKTESADGIMMVACLQEVIPRGVVEEGGEAPGGFFEQV